MLKVKDLLPFSRTRPAVVPLGADLRRVAEKMVEDPKAREVYVLDEEGRLLGVITLQRLLHWVFSSEVSHGLGPAALLELIGARTAGDLALRKPISICEDASVEELLRVMFRYDLDEIPVVSREGEIVDNLNLLEVLSAWLAGDLGPLAPSPEGG